MQLISKVILFCNTSLAKLWTSLRAVTVPTVSFSSCYIIAAMFTIVFCRALHFHPIVWRMSLNIMYLFQISLTSTTPTVVPPGLCWLLTHSFTDVLFLLVHLSAQGHTCVQTLKYTLHSIVWVLSYILCKRMHYAMTPINWHPYHVATAHLLSSLFPSPCTVKLVSMNVL